MRETRIYPTSLIRQSYHRSIDCHSSDTDTPTTHVPTRSLCSCARIFCDFRQSFLRITKKEMSVVRTMGQAFCLYQETLSSPILDISFSSSFVTHMLAETMLQKQTQKDFSSRSKLHRVVHQNTVASLLQLDFYLCYFINYAL